MSLELELEQMLSTDPLWNSLIESKVLNGIRAKPKELLYIEIYYYSRLLTLSGDIEQARICTAYLDDEYDDFFDMNEKIFMEINKQLEKK